VRHRPLSPTIVAVVLLLAALWGGTATAIKVGLRDLPTLGLAGFRFSIGALLVFLWARAQRVPIRLQPGEAAPIFLLTLVFAAQIATFNWGTGLTQAGRSTLILNSYPLWVLLMAHVFVPGDRLSAAKITGAVCAFGGLGIVFSESLSAASRSLAGDLMVLLSAVLLKSYSPSRISVILLTTPLFGIVLSRLVLGEPVSPHLGAGGLLVALGIALAQR
jgi:drug/metabolite transporter (DMT)-like permease